MGRKFLCFQWKDGDLNDEQRHREGKGQAEGPCLPPESPACAVRLVAVETSASAAATSLDGRRALSDASAAQNGPRTCGETALAATNLLRMRPCAGTMKCKSRRPR